MLTVEELLKPRYKVIANYPNGRYRKDEIVVPDKRGWLAWVGIVSEYPEIFKPLAWYEERKEEDMPEYVKINSLNALCANEIYKLKSIDSYYFYAFPQEFTPISEEEYLNYINQQK